MIYTWLRKLLSQKETGSRSSGQVKASGCLSIPDVITNALTPCKAISRHKPKGSSQADSCPNHTHFPEGDHYRKCRLQQQLPAPVPLRRQRDQRARPPRAIRLHLIPWSRSSSGASEQTWGQKVRTAGEGRVHHSGHLY